jgi:hypothetical protein
MLATLDRIAWVERVELPRLTSHDTAELAAGILGRQLAADLADALAAAGRGGRAAPGCGGVGWPFMVGPWGVT